VSQIKQALLKLNKSIDRLEGSAGHIEQSLAGQQRDMFGAAPAAATNGSGSTHAKANGHGGVEGAVIAQRLDQAIDKVEKLLAEA